MNRIAPAALLALLTGCSAGTRESRSDAATPRAEESRMNGAVSPTGEKHPGEIVNDDKVEGRTWTRKASEVPQSIAWVRVGDVWKPVVRIEITGTTERREFKKLGPSGEFLEVTVATMGAPQPRPSPPTPVPTPDPTSEK